MNKVIATLLLLLSITPSIAEAADQYVNGYYRRDGTYVQPYHRSAPDNNFNNNYSSQGNINPYTGQEGTVTYDQYQRKQRSESNNGYNGYGLKP